MTNTENKRAYTQRRFPLSIATAYRPNWKLWEGLRELVQNGIDAETEFGAPMTVDLYNGKLRIENNGYQLRDDGRVMPLDVLLLGHTSKRERSDLIGQFGDGMKIGILALLRLGHAVKLRNGSDVWNFSLGQNGDMESEVVVCDVSPGHKPEPRVRIEIDGISDDDWRMVKERFLHPAIRDQRISLDQVATPYGDLLIGPAYAGKLYVKGIFVQHVPKLRYGYNFREAEVNIDRDLVESYDRDANMRRILSDAAEIRPDLAENMVAALMDSTADFAGISAYSAAYLSDALCSRVETAFDEKFGKDTLAVDSIGESRECESFGKRGVPIGQTPIGAIIKTRRGSFDKVKKEKATETTATYAWHDLTDDERANLGFAADMVAKVESSVTLDSVSIVDFADVNLLGLAKGTEIKLARRILSSRAETLATFIHEAAHVVTNVAADFTPEHTRAIERIWASVAKLLVT